MFAQHVQDALEGLVETRVAEGAMLINSGSILSVHFHYMTRQIGQSPLCCFRLLLLELVCFLAFVRAQAIMI